MEVESLIVGLDGLEEGPESISEAAFGQQSAMRATRHVIRTILDRFSAAGSLFRSFYPFRRRPGLRVPGRWTGGPPGVDDGEAKRGGLQAVERWITRKPAWSSITI